MGSWHDKAYELSIKGYNSREICEILEDEYETPRETSYDSEAVKKKAQQEIVYKRKGG